MFKSSLSLRMVLHKKMKRLTFLPSHGNLLPETEQGKPKKVPKFQSGGFFFSLQGDVRVSWAQEAILCPPASGSQGLCLGVF